MTEECLEFLPFYTITSCLRNASKNFVKIQLVCWSVGELNELHLCSPKLIKTVASFSLYSVDEFNSFFGKFHFRTSQKGKEMIRRNMENNISRLLTFSHSFRFHKSTFSEKNTAQNRHDKCRSAALKQSY